MHLKIIDQKILSKKSYIRPEVIRIVLDNSISLVMMSGPVDPPPIGTGKKDSDEPFKSPFGDKPFS